MKKLTKLLSVVSIMSVTALPVFANAKYTISEVATVPRTGEIQEQTVTQALPDISLKDVYFGLDQATLNKNDLDSIKTYAKYLVEHKDVNVNVEGHADERGGDVYNNSLALKRATSVANQLISFGVEKERIAVVSYGKSRPLSTGHDEGSWRVNRRVDLKSYA